jgi:hypothetical protein
MIKKYIEGLNYEKDTRDLIKNDKLGSFDEIVFVCENIAYLRNTPINDLKSFCLDSHQFIRIPFWGIISLLIFLKLVEFNGKSISLTQKGDDFLRELKKDTNPKWSLATILLGRIEESEEFNDFLDFFKIRYDSAIRKYFFRINSCPLKYSSIRNLLLDLDFFKLDSDYPNSIIIDEKSINYFKSEIIKLQKKKSLVEFKKEQEILILYGEEAEKFVIDYEKKRLDLHKLRDEIKRVSLIDVGAGFDILSFENEDSQTPDRFIEVKSYVDKPYFYWSRNEIYIAEEKGDSYYIYLINRNMVKNQNYTPLIIRNPYKNIFLNETLWKKECINWYFTKID